MPPVPICETLGLLNLCPPAAVFNTPSWFYLSAPNAIWIGIVILLIVLGIFLPFPVKTLDLPENELEGAETAPEKTTS